MKIHVATHCRNDDGVGSHRIIGVFSSNATAQLAIDALAEQTADDLDYPDFFQVDVFDLDELLAPERLALIA
jgi:hypothetical protein